MTKKIFNYFDKLEDKTRAKLSRFPFVYAFIGGVGVILFWRGVWHLADDAYLNSFISLIIGGVILLVTGIFVSAFVGNRLIISGLSGEKKLSDKTIEEIETEEEQIKKMQKTLERVEEKIENLESELKKD
ncbi:hypothetical protein H0W91_01325 [Patescibacteria group bacterium]|nr:hypothetical protein [Patescibacteria group bacterium]